MQPKHTERLTAVKLRKKGLSYSEIPRKVPVSQASLPLWLRKIGLTNKQRTRLAALSLIDQKAGARARHEKHLKGTLVNMAVQKSTWLNRRIDLWTKLAANYWLGLN